MPLVRSVLRSKLFIAAAVLVVAAGAFRLMLPRIVLGYVNRTLGQVEGYDGRVEGIRIHLLRGAYEIVDLRLDRTGGKVPVPFVRVPRIDLSIEWSEVLRRALVGRITLQGPSLNFVRGPTKETTQTGNTPTWKKVTEDLFPFSINRLDIEDANVHYRDFHSDPEIDIFVDKLYVEATNLTNTRSLAQSMFAHILIHNKPGKNDPAVKAVVDLNTFAQAPTFTLRFSLEGLDLTRMNDFFRAYGNFDVEGGTLTLLSEMEAQDWKYKGYAKPFFKGLQVVDWKKDDESLLRLAWEALVGAAASVLENEPRKRVATIVPVEGDFKDKKIDYWTAIGFLLRNAFIEAIKPSFEGITENRG